MAPGENAGAGVPFQPGDALTRMPSGAGKIGDLGRKPSSIGIDRHRDQR